MLDENPFDSYYPYGMPDKFGSTANSSTDGMTSSKVTPRISVAEAQRLSQRGRQSIIPSSDPADREHICTSAISDRAVSRVYASPSRPRQGTSWWIGLLRCESY